MKPLIKDCTCSNWKGVFTVVYRPGDAEAIVECENCGKLWYSILVERMGFAEKSDTVEDYQIPITTEEFEMIKKIKFEDLNLMFLLGRTARVIHEGGIVQIDSDFALSRCGKSFL